MTEFYPWQNALWARWIALRVRMPQALLIKGAEGVGKFDFAMNIAQSLLCEQLKEGGEACQSCPACHWFSQQSHPDFRLIQSAALSANEDEKEGDKKPAKQITIEQIRALSDFSSLSAHQGRHRVVVIHPAESMSNNAANALLKILEEPPSKMLIILISNKPQWLLPTIRSRCLSFSAPLPAPEISTAWLQKQNVNNPQALLAQTGFAPLLALRLAAEDAQSVEQYQHVIRAMMHPEKMDIFILAEQIKNIEPAKVINWLQQWCHDLTNAKLTGNIRYFTAYADSIHALSIKVDVHRLLNYESKLAIARKEASHPLNLKLLYESILLNYQQTMLKAT